jgi:CRISPR system Cascade subunit CasA
MENRFNLIDEPWIPIAGKASASLCEVFTDASLPALGGTPIQKLSLLKLLLAIAQRTITPQNNEEWRTLGAMGLGKACCAYLEDHRSLFYLYGNQPFLQYPILAQWKTTKGEVLPIMPMGRSYHPDIPSDNDTVVNQIQLNRVPDDAQRALFIISVMNYSLGGKRVAEIPALSSSFENKGKNAKPGPSLGNYTGYLQSCLWGRSVLETVWLNLMTRWELSMIPQWAHDEMIPPWEEMPKGEDDEIARRLAVGFMGTLVGLSRFVLLQGDGILYAEGLQYPSHKEGWTEPFMVFRGERQAKFLEMGKKPWRDLDALLSLSLVNIDRGVSCQQIQLLLLRARNSIPCFGVYSGGLKVRGSMGDQSVKQTDDFIDSVVWLDSAILGEGWFLTLEAEMKWLEKTAFDLKTSVFKYYKELRKQKILQCELAESDLWSYCERRFQTIVDGCRKPELLQGINLEVVRQAEYLYDTYCSKETARQLVLWVKHRPNFFIESKKEV